MALSLHTCKTTPHMKKRMIMVLRKWQWVLHFGWDLQTFSFQVTMVDYNSNTALAHGHHKMLLWEILVGRRCTWNTSYANHLPFWCLVGPAYGFVYFPESMSIWYYLLLWGMLATCLLLTQMFGTWNHWQWNFHFIINMIFLEYNHYYWVIQYISNSSFFLLVHKLVAFYRNRFT